MTFESPDSSSSQKRTRKSSKIFQARDPRKVRRRIILRYLLGMFLAAFVGAFLAAAALVAWNWGEQKYDQASEAFVVKEIEILNDGVLGNKRILEMAKVRKNMNLLSLDLLEMQNRLEKPAFIEKASVERELPNILKIRVWERNPELVWNRKPELEIPSNIDALSKNEIVELIQSRVFIDGDGVPMLAPREWYLRGGPVGRCLEIRDAKSEWFEYGKPAKEPMVIRALEFKKFYDKSPMAFDFEIQHISFSEPRTMQVIDEKGGKIIFSKDHFELSLIQWMRVAEVGRLSGKRIEFMDLTITNNCPVIWEDLPDVASMKR